MARVSGEGVGKKGRKRLQTNPGILKTTHQHRGKTYAHALTLALPVYTSGSVARINLVVSLAVCQLVVVNQQPQMREKRTTITKKGM